TELAPRFHQKLACFGGHLRGEPVRPRSRLRRGGARRLPLGPGIRILGIELAGRQPVDLGLLVYAAPQGLTQRGEDNRRPLGIVRKRAAVAPLEIGQARRGLAAQQPFDRPSQLAFRHTTMVRWAERWCQSLIWEDRDMERVLGIGGYFMRAADPSALGAWYRE